MDIISFYSYKGGSGRSVTTFNTLPFLAHSFKASPERPILVVDMDIDSAGITYLLKKNQVFSEPDLIDVANYFSSDTLPESVRTFNGLLNNAVDITDKLGVAEELGPGSVKFLGINPNLIKTTYQANISTFPNRLNHLITACENLNISALVFDSAAGNQIIAQQVLRNSNRVVVCMKATTQSRFGTFDYLGNSFSEQIFDQEAKLIMLPVAIPNDRTMMTSTTLFREHALERLRNQIRDVEAISRQIPNQRGVCIEKYFIDEEHFGIPEVEVFKWKEKCLYYDKNSEGRTLQEGENEAYKRYEILADLINA